MKPIIFNTQMVQAIIQGKKTETRRIRKDNRACLYKEGDILWVRETWFFDHMDKQCYYKADNPAAPICWKPSIFMPAVHARLRLKVISVKAEKLLDITPEAIQAEGIMHPLQDRAKVCGIRALLYLKFKDLWNSINKKRGYAWDDNPAVWVIQFKRV